MSAVSAGMERMVRPTALEPDPRIVVTPLDVDHVEQALRGLGILSSWAHIVEGLRHGFDVGVRAPVLFTSIPENHASSLLDTQFIDSYILEEQAAGRYSHPFLPAELESVIGPFRTLPLGLVPKPHSDKYRLIQDLSYPCNNVRTTMCCF